MPKQVVQDARYDFRGGRNTAISPDLLGSNELVDCTNARLSETYGGFAKRSGTQRIHEVAFPAKIDGVYQWDAPSGKQVVVISNGSLYWRNGSSYAPAFAKLTPAAVARTTGNQGASAGWIDPDGVNDGINSVITVLGGGDSDVVTTIGAANRLFCELGDPAVNGNIPSIDGLYTLNAFKVTADATSLNALGLVGGVSSTVTLETSVNGGGTWQPVPGKSFNVTVAIGASSTQLFGAQISVAGAPAQVWVRLVLTVEVFWTSPGFGTGGTGRGSTQIFDTVYLTNNYPVTWLTGVPLFSTTSPAFFAPFRESTSGAPLKLYIASGGHYWVWDGMALTQLDTAGSPSTPNATAIIPYHTRMFAMVASSTTPGLLPKTIFWSRIGHADDFTTGDKTFGGSAVTDFLTGQQLTALEVIGSSLLMSTADSIMRFTGHASDDIVISQDTEGISAEVGSVGLQALKRYENVCAMFSDRGPYVVTETYAQPSGEQLNPDWLALDKVNLFRTIVEYNRTRKELLFAVPGANDGGYPKTIFSQAVRLQTWQGPWTYPFAMTYLTKYFDANNKPNVLSGGVDGFVRLMDVGQLDDILFDGTGGSAITMTVELPVVHFGLPGVKKTVNWMLLQANLPVGSNLQIKVGFDGGTFDISDVQGVGAGEENYRVDIGAAQGFRGRIQFVESSTQAITINGFTTYAWNMQRTT